MQDLDSSGSCQDLSVSLAKPFSQAQPQDIGTMMGLPSQPVTPRAEQKVSGTQMAIALASSIFAFETALQLALDPPSRVECLQVTAALLELRNVWSAVGHIAPAQ